MNSCRGAFLIPSSIVLGKEMADREEEENLRTALCMSMQSPEPKRSRPPHDSPSSVAEDLDSSHRKQQRELMAAAAEKRLRASRVASSDSAAPSTAVALSGPAEMEGERERVGMELTGEEARELVEVVFGGNVSRGILSHWTNQGIRPCNEAYGCSLWKNILNAKDAFSSCIEFEIGSGSFWTDW